MDDVTRADLRPSLRGARRTAACVTIATLVAAAVLAPPARAERDEDRTARPTPASAPASGTGSAPGTPGTTSLLDLLPADGALLRAAWPAPRVMTQSVGLDTASAPGFVKVRIPPEGAALETAFGVNPEQWSELRSGPFRFAVVVLTARESEGRGRREIVLERRIDPAREPGDRRWFPARVDLDRFAGSEVLLAFLIDTPNLVEPPGDLAGWLDPRLVPRVAGGAQAARTSPDGKRRNADTPTK
jgi:hypothetical protein